ncbi:MAG: hypothetical protein ABSG43_09770 [Solirubrobacteraceae bacterium]
MGGVRWAEQLSGWISFAQADFNQALLEGRRDGVMISVALSLAVDDLDRFVSAASKRADVTEGVVQCPELGGRLQVTRGEFLLLDQSSALYDQLHLRMRYRLWLRDPAGRELHLDGFKLVENDPGYDSWSDTTTLFVRIYSLANDALLATGVLRISPGGVLRELASFRGTEGSLRARLRDVARFGGCFAGGLAKAYVGAPIADGRPSFPVDRAPAPWAVDQGPGRWEPVPGRNRPAPGRHSLERRVVPFAVPDLAFALNLHNLRKAGERARGEPVLLIPGSAVRAEMFYGQPVGTTIADYLLDCGFDVWVENWRASIDLPANSYTLDQGARFDHPAAVAAVLATTNAPSLRAVVHCQGSISFMMALSAGLLPAQTVSHVVSSAISLFFDVPWATWVKQRTMLPVVKVFGTGGDPQWGIRPQTPTGAALAWLARHAERPCGNGPCQVANYLFGTGWDVLFRHANVDDRVHAWSARELGYTPFSLIHQVADSCRNGHIVPATGAPPGTPASYLRRVAPTETRFTLIAGDNNRMFKPAGQKQTCEFLRQCGLHADYVALEGYGHLDTFWGRHAAAKVFPVIRDGLRWSAGRRPSSHDHRADHSDLRAPAQLAAFAARRRRRTTRVWESNP